MRAIAFNIIIFLILISFVACNPPALVISLNVKMPANVVFAKDINHVVIVNNAGFQPSDDGHVAMYKKVKTVLDIPVDSLNILMCRSLMEEIETQKFFSTVDFYNFPFRNDTNYFEVKPLSKVQIDDITTQTGADALIVLDFFEMKSTLGIKNVKGLSKWVTYDVTNRSLFNIYYNGEKHKPLVVNDSLFWDAYGFDLKDAIEGLPYLDDALKTATDHAAKKAMEDFIPHWQPEVRKYFSFSSGNLGKASQMARNSDWNGAFTIWSETYEKTDNLSLRARCAANMALVYEINDDFPQAVEWATQAQKEFQAIGKASDKEEVEELNNYITRLKQRIVESKQLDIQE